MPNTLYEGEKWDKTKKVIKTGYDKTKKHLKKNWREYALGAAVAGSLASSGTNIYQRMKSKTQQEPDITKSKVPKPPPTPTPTPLVVKTPNKPKPKPIIVTKINKPLKRSIVDQFKNDVVKDMV